MPKDNRPSNEQRCKCCLAYYAGEHCPTCWKPKEHLVSRLRAIQPRAVMMLERTFSDGHTELKHPLMLEAADQIEQLTRERDEARIALAATTAAITELGANCDMLRAALEEAIEGAEEVAPGVVKVSPWSTSWLNGVRQLLAESPSETPAPREFWVAESVRPNHVAEAYPPDYEPVLRTMLTEGYIKSLVHVREVMAKGRPKPCAVCGEPNTVEHKCPSGI